MRLKAFRVTNYKTILNSGDVEIDTNVACLMGKNEAGKSAVMQALWKFHNVSGAEYDRLLDLPAELYSRLRTTDPEVTVVEFVLDDEDKAEFQTAFPLVGAAPDAITVHSTYDQIVTVEYSLSYEPPSYGTIAAAVQSAIQSLAIPTPQPAEVDPAVTAPLTAASNALQALRTTSAPDKSAPEIPVAIVQSAITAYSAVPEAHLAESGNKTIEALEDFATHCIKDLEGKINDWFIERLPIFIYFEDYGRLKTRIHLPTFVAQQKNPPKDSEGQMLFRTQLALFEWANLDAVELQKLGAPRSDQETQEAVERRKAERSRLLESASYHLSGDWMDWWDQRTHDLKIGADGDELELRVSDNVNPWLIPFGDRSRGFQWFFSFYLTFLVESSKAHKGAIILLDEPGLHLHPTAQEKLLAFFQRISRKNQIIYSSHSMFMVDPDHVDNVRTVFLAAQDPENPKSRAYTRVSESTEPEGDRDTLLPMQAAGAYRLAQTLFLGRRTLIVEGISDYWLMRSLSSYLEAHGGGGLHTDTLVLWAGGTSHVLPLASIMAAREQMGPNRMAVLLDSDHAGMQKARRLIEMMAHGQQSVMLLGDIIGVPKAQGEDMAEIDELLLGLEQLGRTPSKIPSREKGETNVEFLHRLFLENGWGDLTHEVKAQMVLHLTNIWWKGTSPLSETIERGKVLFDFIDKRFELLGATEAAPEKAIN